MIITLFGGTGFVGRHLTERLRGDGHRLRIVARHRPTSDRRLHSVEYLQGDLTRPATISESLKGADAAVNLVGAVKLADEAAYFALHRDGARTVAQTCREAGVDKLIHFSALGVDSQAPSSADRSKAMGERVVREVLPQAAILRPSLIYGPDDHLLTLFEAVSRRLPVIPLFGAETRFQPLYVGDLCEAMARLLSGAVETEPVYQACGPEVFSLREIVSTLCRSLGRNRLVIPVPDRMALWTAALMERLPVPPFNSDQVLLMKTDKIAQPGLPTLRSLGVTPRRLGEWLHYRK